MSTKNDIRHLWREAFGDSEEYLDMYFDRIYRESDALTLESDGRLVSTVLMQDYNLWFHSREVPVAYIAGVTTRRAARGHGHATALVNKALKLAHHNGKMLCAIIPAHDWLYYFFDRFGFSPVFLTDSQRFTSLHAFATAGEYETVADPYSDTVFSAFEEFERERPGGILHNRRDFINILDDLSFKPDGTFVAVSRADMPVAAMAWAQGQGDILQINEVLGTDADARRGAMKALREKFPNRPFRYLAPADTPEHRHLYPRGMARITDALQCLTVIAESHPNFKCSVRVHDPLIEENNRTFILDKGECRTSEDNPDRLDFDVSIDVLTRIVFSSPATGDILGFPSERTHISLMPH